MSRFTANTITWFILVFGYALGLILVEMKFGWIGWFVLVFASSVSIFLAVYGYSNYTKDELLFFHVGIFIGYLLWIIFH